MTLAVVALLMSRLRLIESCRKVPQILFNHFLRHQRVARARVVLHLPSESTLCLQALCLIRPN